MQLPMPIIFSCIVYWLIGYQANAGKFFSFMSFMILCSNAATSLAMMISAWCRTTELTVIVLPMALEVTRLFGGFFLSPKNLPDYFIWLDALSYVKYTYVGAHAQALHVHVCRTTVVHRHLHQRTQWAGVCMWPRRPLLGHWRGD